MSNCYIVLKWIFIFCLPLPKNSVLANYFGWSVAHSLCMTLSKEFRDAAKILRRALIGSEGSESPWRYCVSDTNNVMGFSLGAMFVKSVFKGESKEMARLMIEEIKDAFKDNLPNLKWMDAETRKLAKEKVSESLCHFIFCSTRGSEVRFNIILDISHFRLHRISYRID